MPLTGQITRFLGSLAARRFDAAAADARAEQAARLRSIVARNAGTEYGRRYGFDRIETVDEFRRRVPVVTYDDLRDDLERVADGARHVLTADDPVRFALTRGTTGPRKRLPVVRDPRGPRDERTWLHHARAAHAGLLGGATLSLADAAPAPIAAIDDYAARQYVRLRLAVGGDVRLLRSAHPASILGICERINELSDRIIGDVRDGTAARDLDLDPAVRAAVERGLRPDPDRAGRLERARSSRDGVLKPADYWPGLLLIGCWKGGAVGHYVDKFASWFDPDARRPVPVRDPGYVTGEGRGSIPMSDRGHAGALAITSSFFEFVAVDDLEGNRDDPDAWTFRTADELTQGTEHYLFVTTAGGLYRYDLDDVVRVEGPYRRTPQIAFVRKGRAATGITGAEVPVHEVIGAVEAAAERSGVVPGHFHPRRDADHDRCLLRVELAQKCDRPLLQSFLRDVDDCLRGTSAAYRAERDADRLAPPVLHVMGDGWPEETGDDPDDVVEIDAAAPTG